LTLEVISSTGQVIYTDLQTSPNVILEIPTINFKEGLYLIRANSGSGDYVKRFVVTR